MPPRARFESRLSREHRISSAGASARRGQRASNAQGDKLQTVMTTSFDAEDDKLKTLRTIRFRRSGRPDSDSHDGKLEKPTWPPGPFKPARYSGHSKVD